MHIINNWRVNILYEVWQVKLSRLLETDSLEFPFTAWCYHTIIVNGDFDSYYA